MLIVFKKKARIFIFEQYQIDCMVAKRKCLLSLFSMRTCYPITTLRRKVVRCNTRAEDKKLFPGVLIGVASIKRI